MIAVAVVRNYGLEVLGAETRVVALTGGSTLIDTADYKRIWEIVNGYLAGDPLATIADLEQQSDRMLDAWKRGVASGWCSYKDTLDGVATTPVFPLMLAEMVRQAAPKTQLTEDEFLELYRRPFPPATYEQWCERCRLFPPVKEEETNAL